jgi:hypothetical protein
MSREIHQTGREHQISPGDIIFALSDIPRTSSFLLHANLIMQSRLIIAIIIFFLVLASFGLSAQKLVIRMDDGTEYDEPLSALQKLTFSQDELIVNFISGPGDAYPLSDIRKLYFNLAVSTDENTFAPGHGPVVFPNPAGNFITVRGIPADAGFISIYRMDGAPVLVKTVSADCESLDVTGLPSGLYLLKASGYTTKFIKP